MIFNCRYDAVLEHGLPDWKQPVYYYRRVRKMGLWELSILLLAVITIGQFLYGWAAYLEKQIVLVRMFVYTICVYISKYFLKYYNS